MTNKIGVSYPTAKKYLNNLVKYGVVIKKEVLAKRKLKNVNSETLYHFDMRRSPR